jgi:hypothetical protein
MVWVGCQSAIQWGFVFKLNLCALLRSVATNVGEKETSVLLSYVNPNQPTNHEVEPAGFNSLPPGYSSLTLNTFERDPVLPSRHKRRRERSDNNNAPQPRDVP